MRDLSNALVLGSSGYVGQNMAHALEYDGTGVCGWTTVDGDLSKEIPSSINDFPVVVNCAGLADMDRAEEDSEYCVRMVRANSLLPLLVRRVFEGYFVHISSPFSLCSPELSAYGMAKQLADEGLRDRSDTLIVYPGWLYGGRGSQQIDAMAQRGLHKPLLIDNVKRADPTHVDYFCECVAWLVKQRIVGNVLIYQYASLTAEQLIKHILRVWGDAWTVGEYQDRAKRPVDGSYSDKHFPHFSRCRLEKGSFHVEAHVF